MTQAPFFLEKDPANQKKDALRRRNVKAIVLFLVSAAYGLFILFIMSLDKQGYQGASLLALYVYGLLGGLGILLVNRFYASLDRSRKILVEVLEKSAEARAITDPDGDTIYANKRFHGLMGETAPSLAAFTQLFGDPAAVEQALENLRNKSAPAGSATGEFHAHNEDMDLRLQITCQHIIGWPGYVHWRFDDITPRYKMEAAIREEREKLRDFTDNAPVGFFSVDGMGKFLFANNTLNRLLGKTTGKHLHDFLANPPKNARPFDFFETGGDRQQGDVLMKSANGTTFNATIVHSITHDAAGNTVTHSVLSDTSQQRRMQQALEESRNEQKNLEKQFTQSQKMQAVGQLAGGIAHDFNNLLTAMIGFADLLLLRHKPDDPSFGDIQQIKQNANRAANLVRQLLAFSRQQTLQPRILDVTDVLAELSHLLRRLIGTNINLNITHGSDLAPIKADQGQMEQVLVNLVVNARDAMPQGGKLEIRTGRHANVVPEKLAHDEFLPPGDWVSIAVEDAGTGIAPELLPRIFEPFFTTKAVGAGTGLGLATAHGIIHQTGGYITVDSTFGKGATFTIYLPAHAEEKAEKAPAVEEKPAVTDLTGSAKILLVEDEDAVRVFSARALSNKGYEVVDAPGGAAALTLLEKFTPDILITDVMMPEMDGTTLAKIVREKYPKLKIVFISGYAEDKFKEHLGADVWFLPKPFTLRQLAEKVKEVMAD